MIFPENGPVVLPGHAAVPQPAEPLELALGQNDIHILDTMCHTINVGDGIRSGRLQKIFEIHLVQHSLDVGQTNLERSVGVLTAIGAIQSGGVLLGDDTLAIKAERINIHPLLHPVIPAEIALTAIILHSDYRDIVFCGDRIVDDDNPMRSVDPDALHPCTAGEQQPIVGVELA